MTYNVEETEVEERNTISTGNIEIDRRIGGGIPYGTLLLIEGDDASGKSSITQQLFYGALKAGEDVVCYSTETTIQSLIPQMKSIGMDCTDYFIMNHLRIFPISTRGTDTNTDFMFDALANHIEKEQSARVLVIDSLTTYISSLGGEKIQDFFQKCKRLCDQGKVVICTVHSNAFDENALTRVRSICDAYLMLKVTRAGSALVKTLEVAKIKGAESTTGNISGFQVEPGLGVRLIPISRAKA